MKRNIKEIEIDEKKSTLFYLIAKDNPCFALVETDMGIYNYISKGFDMQNILNYLVDYAKEGEFGDDFKEAITDLLLDLNNIENGKEKGR